MTSFREMLHPTINWKAVRVWLFYAIPWAIVCAIIIANLLVTKPQNVKEAVETKTAEIIVEVKALESKVGQLESEILNIKRIVGGE